MVVEDGAEAQVNIALLVVDSSPSAAAASVHLGSSG